MARPEDQVFSLRIVKSSLAVVALAFAALPLFAQMAAAGPNYQFTLSQGTQGGTTIAPTANVGKITLTQLTTTSVRLDLDLFPYLPTTGSNFGIINTGGPHTPFAFNLAGSGLLTASFVTPNLTCTIANPLPNCGPSYFKGGTAQTTGPFHFSLNTLGGANTPFGTFGIALDRTGGNGSSRGYFGDLSLVLNRVGGLDTNQFTRNDVDGDGFDDWYFSADLSNGERTGAQAWGIRTCLNCANPPPIPEPASIAVLLTGLVGMGALRRRRKKT